MNPSSSSPPLAPLAAIDDVELPPVCARCLEHDGLCVAHQRGVLPLLDDAMVRRLYALQAPKRKPPPPKRDPAVERAMRREERKQKKARTVAARRQRKVIDRFERAVRGEFTRSRPAVHSAA